MNKPVLTKQENKSAILQINNAHLMIMMFPILKTIRMNWQQFPLNKKLRYR